MRRQLLQLTIWSLCVTAFIAIIAILGGGFGHVTTRSLLTVLAVSVYSLLGFCGAILYDKEPGNRLAFATMLATAIGFVVTLAIIWSNWHDQGDLEWQAFFLLLTLAVTGSHACVLEARRRATDSNRVRQLVTATQAAIAVVATMLCFAIIYKDKLGDAYWRFFGVLAVLDVLGTLLVPIVRRLPVRQS